MFRRLAFLSTAIVSLLASASAFSEKYSIDPAHSSIEFKIRHLMISNVIGAFKEFKGSGEGSFTKEGAKIGAVDIEIKAASVDTNQAKRDEHLKSKEIFDVDQFKTINFKSTKVDYKGKFPSKIHGDLTLHGVTKPIVFDIEWGGVVVDPFKNERVAFEAEAKINRKDFGITWNKPLETGGLLVGEDVKITVRVEAIREKETPKEAPKSAPEKKSMKAAPTKK